MELSHLFLQETSIEVRVDFRGRDLGVPQHFLNRPQVGAAFDEVDFDLPEMASWSAPLASFAAP